MLMVLERMPEGVPMERPSIVWRLYINGGATEHHFQICICTGVSVRFEYGSNTTSVMPMKIVKDSDEII